MHVRPEWSACWSACACCTQRQGDEYEIGAVRWAPDRQLEPPGGVVAASPEMDAETQHAKNGVDRLIAVHHPAVHVLETWGGGVRGGMCCAWLRVGNRVFFGSMKNSAEYGVMNNEKHDDPRFK